MTAPPRTGPRPSATPDWELPRWARGKKARPKARKGWRRIRVPVPGLVHRHKILSSLLGGFLLMVGAAIYLWMSVNLPANPVPQDQTSFFLDADGNLITRLPAPEDRRVVKLSEISKPMITATIAAEDRGFYRHGGVDLASTARALWVDVRYGGLYQGGSTITQQLVKNVYTGTNRNLIRKVKEAVLSVKLERVKEKDEILELYLNTVYFGRGAYGVEAAAHVYFRKDAKDLDWGQAAYLAGLIAAPSYGDVTEDPTTARAMRDRVLQALLEERQLTTEQVEPLRQQRMEICPPAESSAERLCVAAWDRRGIEHTGPTAYFLEYVRRVLEPKYGQKLYTGGYRIHTTLDPRMQREAERAVLETLDRPDDPAGALVAIDTSGAVRAMVGGRDFAKSQVNLAIGTEGGGSGRQGGSTFKPFVLAAAIEDGISVDSYVPGWSPREVDFDEETINVWNYGNSQFGTLTLTDATTRSVNTAYSLLGARVGVKRIFDEARELGIRSRLDDKGARVVLGLAEVSVLEMANAYCTFAARGLHAEPRVVTKIVGPDGKVVEEFPVKTRRSMKENDADQVNWVLRQVISRGTGGRAAIGRQAAGKTGTHDENTNAWFVGYTPEQLCTAVWMGYPEGNVPMTNVHGITVDGGTLPAQIWGDFMAAAVEPLDATRFTEPDFTGKVESIGGARRARSTPVEAQASEDETTTSSTDPSASTGADGSTTTTPTDSAPTSTFPRGVPTRSVPSSSTSTSSPSSPSSSSTTTTTLIPIPTSPG